MTHAILTAAPIVSGELCCPCSARVLDPEREKVIHGLSAATYLSRSLRAGPKVARTQLLPLLLLALEDLTRKRELPCPPDQPIGSSLKGSIYGFTLIARYLELVDILLILRHTQVRDDHPTRHQGMLRHITFSHPLISRKQKVCTWWVQPRLLFENLLY